MLLSNLQATDNWEQPGNVGDDGGANPRPHGTYTLIPGTPMQVTIQPGYGYDNFYFLKRLNRTRSLSNYNWFRLSLNLVLGDWVKKAQAFEFEIQQVVNKQLFNMAWQADLMGSKRWRMFDYATSQWQETIFPCDDLFTQKEVGIDASFQRTNNNFISHNHLTLTFGNRNDMRVEAKRMSYPVFVTRPSVPTNENDYLNVAFQLDSNSKGEGYAVTLDEIQLYMKGAGAAD